MTGIEPMLAAPMKKGNITDWKQWAVEEKFDGHRVVVVHQMNGSIAAFSRPRGDGRMLPRTLSPKIIGELARLAPGVYDGELMSVTGVATDVKRNDLQDQTRLIVFDIQEFEGCDQSMATYVQRRATLTDIFKESKPDPKVVSLAKSKALKSEGDLVEFLTGVWDREGEGAIIKKLDSKYYRGKRAGARGCPLVWIKVKREFSSTLRVIGFERGTGEVIDRGPHAKVVVQDKDGNVTTCKTLNDHELGLLDRAMLDPKTGKHPAIGRLLVIDHYGRTRDGGYRGPVRWDRWAEPGEEQQ
jgi:ATP-dependent DNA ligase